MPPLYTVSVFLCAGVTAASATDYFVSPRGNDRAEGSAARPFETINRGLTAANRAGDRIVVTAGTYRPRATLVMRNPGAAERPITLMADKNAQVVIDGVDLPPDRSIIDVGTSYVRIEGLTLQNAPRSGIAIYGPGSRVHHVDVVGNTVHHCQISGIYAGFRSQADPVRDLLFENNTVHHASLQNDPKRPGQWAYSIGAGTSKNVTIRRNRVSNAFGEGIGLFLSDRGRIEQNTVSDCYSVNIYLDNTTNTVVDRNYAFSTGDRNHFRFRHPATGIQIANENYPGPPNLSAGNTITNNVLVGNYFSLYVGNYQRGGGFRDSLFAHNTCVGATSRVLHIDSDVGHRNSQIVNNIFVQRPAGQVTDVEGPLEGIQFNHNLWFGGFVHPSVRHPTDVIAEPLFRNREAAPLSFQLEPDSPARNQVPRLSSVPSTFEGRSRETQTNLGAF